MPSIDFSSELNESDKGSQSATLYLPDFFDFVEVTATRSAQVIVPYVLDLFKACSVVDVGCGRGAWLRVFAEHGVESICGIDGAYVDRSRLLIPQRRFITADLGGDFVIPGKFDLAICLEVGEHLPYSSAAHLVDELVTCAPVVLFSAAVPGQGGTGHLNEQWPEYWRGLFANHSYRLVDAIRGRILQDPRVDWWYRQNIVVYCQESILTGHQILREYLVSEGQPCIEWIHKNMLAKYEPTSISGRTLCRLLIRRVLERIRPGNSKVS